MTIKKSLLAVATASTVALAGTGIASAQDDDTPKPPQLSADGSLDNFDLGEQLGAVFGSVDGTTHEWNLGLGIKGLAALVAPSPVPSCSSRASTAPSRTSRSGPASTSANRRPGHPETPAIQRGGFRVSVTGRCPVADVHMTSSCQT